MGDVKDILGLSRDAGGSEGAGSKKEKPKELKERPKGMSRETFNLLHGSHHIQQGIVLDDIVKKDEAKAAPTYAQVTYQFLPFKNEARSDDLELRHWVQCYKDASGRTRPKDDGPYQYAKLNVSAGTLRYDDAEYETVIRRRFPESDSGWSRAETDYLLDLCERFDLRFIVIADYWDFPDGAARSVEDLKERYYAIAAELTKARAGMELLAANQPLLRQPYDAQKERERKAYLSMLLSRTPLQLEEEDQILQKAEAITAARKAEAAAKRPQGAPLLHPATFSNSILELPFFDHTVIPFAPPKPGVYLRRQQLEDSKKVAVNQQAHSQKVAKALDGILTDMKVPVAPEIMSRAMSGMYLALHSEVLHLVDLKLRHQRPVAKGGVEEGRGKRTIKAKTPRYEEAIQAPPSKRNRLTR